jgi:hypothetical protein
VHGLRKARPSHRGLRPRILSFAHGAALAAALIGISLAAAACSGRAPASAAAAPAAPPGWYQLQADGFTWIADVRGAAAVARRPWTVQARVADFAYLDDALFCALNGVGVAGIAIDNAGRPAFTYHRDPLIFSHRTITTLLARQGTLAVHLYYNALLNDAPAQDVAMNAICLAAYRPGQAGFSLLIPPFQEKNPDWEAVGFAPESENSFDFEWKHTDAVETRFAYTRYHADTKTEETVSRDTFLSALGVPFISGHAVPSDLSSFFGACRSLLPTPAAGTAFQFSLRSRESPVRRNYRSLKQSESAVSVAVFEEKGTRLALLPDGRVLRAAIGVSATQTIVLPALPPGFRYTDLAKAGSWLIVPWEEIFFTDVGRAGILVYPLPG